MAKKFKIYYPAGMQIFGEALERECNAKRYNPETDIYEKVLFIGLYSIEDYKIFAEHRGRKAIFWNGSDVTILEKEPIFQEILKAQPRITHATHNEQLKEELAKMGIEAEIAPIFFGDPKAITPSFIPAETTEFYMTMHPERETEYGLQWIRFIENDLENVKIHIYGVTGQDTEKVVFHGIVPEEQMNEEIKKFHGAIRLNKHDGESQTVLKSILLGQYPITLKKYDMVAQAEDSEKLKEEIKKVQEKTKPNLETRDHWLEKLNNFNWLKNPKNSVSLVMIVKDEGKGLETAIKSALPLVDNIVISVDKNSTDNTLEVAKKWADTVKHHTWENDFSKARNFAEEGIKTDWCLMIDGHEYIEEVKNFEKHLKNKTDGLSVRVRMEDGFIFHFPRIYRPNLKWTGAVHNLNNCKNVSLYEDFLIQHDRENLQSTEAAEARRIQRKNMIPQIMHERLKKDRKDDRALFYLAIHYGDHEKPNIALKYYEKYLKYCKKPHDRWIALYNMAGIGYNLRRPLLSLKCLRKAEKELPGRWETSMLIGLTYMQFGQWAKAAKALVGSFNQNTQIYEFNPFEKKRGEIWNLIATCLFNLKKFKESGQAWEEALKATTDEKERQRIQQILMLVGRLEEVK